MDCNKYCVLGTMVVKTNMAFHKAKISLAGGGNVFMVVFRHGMDTCVKSRYFLRLEGGNTKARDTPIPTLCCKDILLLLPPYFLLLRL